MAARPIISSAATGVERSERVPRNRHGRAHPRLQRRTVGSLPSPTAPVVHLGSTRSSDLGASRPEAPGHETDAPSRAGGALQEALAQDHDPGPISFRRGPRSHPSSLRRRRRARRELLLRPYTQGGWAHLATVIDISSRRVVGWALADHMRTEVVSDALMMAFGSRMPPKGAIFHSDRGCQYVQGLQGPRPGPLRDERCQTLA
jgi:transposase InsO family protein